MPHQSGAPFASVRSFPREHWYPAGVIFLSPPPFPFFALAPTVRVTISTLPNLPLSLIKDGGYNITNTNKVSPTQNTPALQASVMSRKYYHARQLRYNKKFLPAQIPWIKINVFEAILSNFTLVTGKTNGFIFQINNGGTLDLPWL